jgi:hypothetical protein
VLVSASGDGDYLSQLHPTENIPPDDRDKYILWSVVLIKSRILNNDQKYGRCILLECRCSDSTVVDDEVSCSELVIIIYSIQYNVKMETESIQQNILVRRI